MKTYKRICIKDYKLEATNGTLELKRGTEYITSEENNRRVTVFTNFWVSVPSNLFAGEVKFT